MISGDGDGGGGDGGGGEGGGDGGGGEGGGDGGGGEGGGDHPMVDGSEEVELRREEAERLASMKWETNLRGKTTRFAGVGTAGRRAARAMFEKALIVMCETDHPLYVEAFNLFGGISGTFIVGGLTIYNAGARTQSRLREFSNRGSLKTAAKCATFRRSILSSAARHREALLRTPGGGVLNVMRFEFKVWLRGAVEGSKVVDEDMIMKDVHEVLKAITDVIIVGKIGISIVYLKVSEVAAALDQVRCAVGVNEGGE